MPKTTDLPFTDGLSVCTLYGARSFRDPNPKVKIPARSKCRVVESYTHNATDVAVLFFEDNALWVHANWRCVRPMNQPKAPGDGAV